MANNKILLTARVWVNEEGFNDSEMDAITTSRTVPTTGFTQMQTLGDVSIEFDDTYVQVGSDQTGMEDAYGQERNVNITIPFADYDFERLMKYVQIDPEWSSGDTAIDWSNINGIIQPDFSLVIYAKKYDPSNETDTPDVTLDPQTHVVFRAMRTSGASINYNSEQGIVEVTLTGMSSKSTGSSRGKKGATGTFTAA